MPDLATLMTFAEAARPILQGWIILSVITAGSFCWLVRSADPHREAELSRQNT